MNAMSTPTPTPSQSKLTIYRGWLDTGKHVWSPFVVKLEARLRFAGVPYTTECGSTQNAPNGKIPYIECERLQPPMLGDSSLIIKRLVEESILPDLNREFPAETRAQDLALRSLLEDKLYFYHTYERWGENYYAMRDHILSSLVYPMRVLVGQLIYRHSMKTLHGQGTGRYSATEIAAFRQEIWESVNALLLSSKRKAGSESSGPFWVLGGEKPTEADGSLFGFIVSVLICTACPGSQGVVRGFPVLLDYAGRIHNQYFPDYEKWA